MSFYTPAYGGVPIFGLAVSIEQVPMEAPAGRSVLRRARHLSVFGGYARGRTFQISGVLYDVDLPTLNADEDVFTPGVSGSIADGIARARSIRGAARGSNVIYLGQFTPDPMGPKPGSGSGAGWILPYRAVFHGLS